MKLKKLAILVLGLMMIISLASCKSSCKHDGCEDEVYEVGYCKYHYNINKAQEAIGNVANDIDKAAKRLHDKIFGKD